MKDFKPVNKIEIKDIKEAIDCLQQLYMAVVVGRNDSLNAACIRTQKILQKIDNFQDKK